LSPQPAGTFDAAATSEVLFISRLGPTGMRSWRA
jgi:hypothetical protein